MYLLKWKEKDWLIIRQSEIACNTMEKFQKSCPSRKKSWFVQVYPFLSALKWIVLLLKQVLRGRDYTVSDFCLFHSEGAYQLFDSVARLL